MTRTSISEPARTRHAPSMKQPLKKILLLTDINPCTNFTAGLVLAQLCSFMPEGSIACFAVQNETLDPVADAKLSWLKSKTVAKPNEYHDRPKPGKFDALKSFARETFTEKIEIPRIAHEAAEFGRQFGADAIWCVVEGQSLIRLSNQVTDLMKIPLYCQVWDPPGWWLRANLVDGWSSPF